MYHKKGNQTLEGSSALNIQSTKKTLSQSEKPGFSLLNITVFIRFEEKVSKYESNENCLPKLHIFIHAVFYLFFDKGSLFRGLKAHFTG